MARPSTKINIPYVERYCNMCNEIIINYRNNQFTCEDCLKTKRKSAYNSKELLAIRNGKTTTPTKRTRKKKPETLHIVAKKANEHHMSYGLYVSKYLR